MKLNKQNKIVVGIVALVLALTVGYALFNQSLNIGGTASADGKFQLTFYSVGTVKEVGSSGTMVTSSDEDKTLTITVPKLEYPGAYVQVPVVIKNTGTVDAKLLGITTEGLSNDDMEVTYTGLEQNDIINPDAIRDIVITIKWKESSVTTSSSLSFNIGLNYEQVKVGDITTGSNESSFPVVEGQLGDSVYFKYDNGVINITGSGDMWDGAIESGGYCDLGLVDHSYCTLGDEINLKVIEKLGITNEKVRQGLSYMSFFITGFTYDDLGMSKDEFKQYIISEFSLSDSEAEECVEIINSIPKSKSLSIDSGITSLRNNFFFGVKISELILPSTITKINTLDSNNSWLSLFVFCKINEVVLEDRTTVLNKGILTFEDGSEIGNLVIPEGVTTIKKYAIAMPDNLNTLVIPSTVTSIEGKAIAYDGLTTIVNTTGRAFDWNAILGNESGAAFETGSVELSSGQIINITK